MAPLRLLYSILARGYPKLLLLYGNVIAELGEERTTQILSDMRTLVEAMEHASKKMHLKEAE